MNTTPSPASSDPARLEILNSRLFDAPRESVFAAFANPVHLAHWWGPNGFTNTIHEFEFRPGGAWRLTMRGPDGAEYENVSEFVEIVKPGKIIFQHLRPMHWYEMTMTYADAPGLRTQLTWRMVLDRSPEHERLKSYISEANEQNFDRLAAHLHGVSF